MFWVGWDHPRCSGNSARFVRLTSTSSLTSFLMSSWTWSLILFLSLLSSCRLSRLYLNITSLMYFTDTGVYIMATQKNNPPLECFKILPCLFAISNLLQLPHFLNFSLFFFLPFLNFSPFPHSSSSILPCFCNFAKSFPQTGGGGSRSW